MTAISTAAPPSEPAELDEAAFAPLVLPPNATPNRTPADAPIAISPEPILDLNASVERSFGPRPTPRQRAAARVVVVPPPTPRPLPPSGPGRRVTGTASWYCLAGVSACHHAYPGGMYAAAGPALRVGDWRGRRVRVCAGSDCVTVRLIDWCQCYGNRVIDLYSDAYRRLAPLSTGTQRVTVGW